MMKMMNTTIPLQNLEEVLLCLLHISEEGLKIYDLKKNDDKLYNLETYLEM